MQPTKKDYRVKENECLSDRSKMYYGGDIIQLTDEQYAALKNNVEPVIKSEPVIPVKEVKPKTEKPKTKRKYTRRKKS